MSLLSSRSISAPLPSSLASSPKPSRRRNPPLLPSITPLVRSRLIHSSAPFTPLSPSKSISLEISINPPRAAWRQPKYVYPDPIPEFAVAETQKFQGELRKKLLKNKETFGDDIDAVVKVCAEIFSDFLHKEYGGPGTLLVEPFTDMLLALKEKKLPGAPVAARAALLWAQNYVDQDWEIWTSQHSK
ncbi:protein PLASTID REDOX INSENSITIVE 2, chloroplastic-like [Phoenix dactylifera]|uniref:Protein PLASTID REDOX INSENSITIVE 2, chloroplastic-like n=1 Tax=Phoenix dactylifera TaxID=42345 RepID=A0A8B7C884_PHODC|nr:protein PLASTID REDOX INSENSITIVE 2, chloroplastic-like [Phoenix dactylifera]